ncbi:MAG: N-acetyltransferase [Chitinophagaceae bacterium]|nr:MAG: N-acetyltransferase [Chitinophagaceae bacterium]
MNFTLHLTDKADPETRSAIVQPLREYNTARAGNNNLKPLVIEIRNNENIIIGGYWGGTDFGWLCTSLLIVPEELRGAGIGTRIMQTAENEALIRGCHGAWLDTFEFQAKAFYEKIGYSCFGILPEYPKGFSRFFMQKLLIPIQEPV